MWNDKETDLDLLGHDKIAQTIIEMVNDENLRPLTVGIYGDWGAGKSSVLSILANNLDEQNKESESKIHFIKFNGWLFQGFEDTRTALMETIVSELVAKLPPSKKIKRLAASLLHRIEWLKLAKLGGKLALAAAHPASILPFLLGTAIDAEEENSDEAKTVTVKVKKEDQGGLLKPSTETTAQHINGFRKEFRELVEAANVESLVVLVDDLDRCLPGAVIDILEAIRLFLFVDGTVFVISADERMIEYAVQNHFPNLPNELSRYPKQYLEKLIQIPIRIPVQNLLQTTNYVKFLILQNYLGKDLQKLREIYVALEESKQNPYDTVELTYEFVIERFSSAPEELRSSLQVAEFLSASLSRGLRGNPRNTKRFLNTLFLRMRIAKVYRLENAVRLDVLGKLMLLENFQAEAYDKLVKQIIESSDGILREHEHNIEDGESGSSGSVDDGMPTPTATELEEWRLLQPSLSGIDLRPYLFICREKVTSLGSIGAMPERLSDIVTRFQSNSILLRNAATQALTALSQDEILLVFAQFERDIRSAPDLKTQPPVSYGLFAITNAFPPLEDRLLQFLESLPTANLGPWAASFSIGLRKGAFKVRYEKLLQTWSEHSENASLKSTAKALLKEGKH